MLKLHVVMAPPFLDRDDNQRRLRRFMGGDDSRLAVLYGRRRCGKSTLVQRMCAEGDAYALADERESSLQAQALASEIARVVPGFDAARYPSWDALFTSLEARVQRLNLVLDEFPYLVASAPELPSVIQRHLDRPGPPRLRLVLCGSSQRMMQGLALDRNAPLYGRAQEILGLIPNRRDHPPTRWSSGHQWYLVSAWTSAGLFSRYAHRSSILD